MGYALINDKKCWNTVVRRGRRLALEVDISRNKEKELVDEEEGMNVEEENMEGGRMKERGKLELERNERQKEENSRRDGSRDSINRMKENEELKEILIEVFRTGIAETEEKIRRSVRELEKRRYGPKLRKENQIQKKEWKKNV